MTPVPLKWHSNVLWLPGNKACLYGDNLDKVESILIGGMAATDITYVESEDGNYVEYTVPAGLSEGDYRLFLSMPKEMNMAPIK